MPSYDPQIVSYLHDAAVHEIRHCVGDDDGKRLLLRLQCDPLCGFEQWNDRTLVVEFYDPLLVLSHMCGHVIGGELFDQWSTTVSSAMKEEVNRMAAVGIRPPVHLVRLVFHSGSAMEVAFDEVKFLLQEE